MNIEKYRNHCISKKGVTESFPFPSLPNVLVFKVAGKMFTATDVETFASISVKHDPDSIDEMRAKYPAITKHKYFPKNWSLVVMDNSIPDKILLRWIDTSCELTVAKLTKKVRATLGL